MNPVRTLLPICLLLIPTLSWAGPPEVKIKYPSGGWSIERKVTIKGTLRVEGEFKGDIETPESFIIGKSGVVHANIKVKNAIIGGQLFGNVTAENKIELQSGSHVEGDIKTKRLVIDEGVFFEGNCSMGSGQRMTPPPKTDKATEPETAGVKK